MTAAAVDAAAAAVDAAAEADAAGAAARALSRLRSCTRARSIFGLNLWAGKLRWVLTVTYERNSMCTLEYNLNKQKTTN